MSEIRHPYLQCYPDAEGYYGQFGGSHYPPEMKPALQELLETYLELRQSPEFQRDLDQVRKTLQGRPTPVHYLKNLSEQAGGAQIFVKREDLNHTGAHKINHCVGFALLAKKMGKTKLIAETGAGQHGVALATAAAHFGLECEVHMGGIDVKKQSSNVARMELLGARVIASTSGQSALKDASDSAFVAYTEQHSNALYAIGSAIGPHPFPMIVRDFQAVVGQEAREQFLSTTEGNYLNMWLPASQEDRMRWVYIPASLTIPKSFCTPWSRWASPTNSDNTRRHCYTADRARYTELNR